MQSEALSQRRQARASIWSRFPAETPAIVALIVIAGFVYWKWGFEERLSTGATVSLSDSSASTAPWLRDNYLNAASTDGSILTLRAWPVSSTIAFSDTIASPIPPSLEFDLATTIPRQVKASAGLTLTLVSWSRTAFPQSLPLRRQRKPVQRPNQVAPPPVFGQATLVVAVKHDRTQVAWISSRRSMSFAYVGTLVPPSDSSRRGSVQLLDSIRIRPLRLDPKEGILSEAPTQIAFTRDGTLALYDPSGPIALWTAPGAAVTTLQDATGNALTVTGDQLMDVVGDYLVFRHVPDGGFPQRASVTLVDPRRDAARRRLTVYQSGEEGFDQSDRSWNEQLPIAISPNGIVAVGTPSGDVKFATLAADSPATDSSAVAPGPVRAMAFVEEGLIVAGDFRGIHLHGRRGDLEIGPTAIGTNFLAAENGALVWGNSGGFYSASLTTTRVPTTDGIWLPAMILVLGASGLRTVRRPQPKVSGTAAGQRAESLPVFPPPTVPEDLAVACAKGQCILYAGAGLSEGAGYPLWRPFTEGLVAWAAERQLIPPTLVDTLRRAVGTAELGSLVDVLVSTLEQGGHGQALQDYLKEQFLVTKSLTNAHKALRNVGFQAAITPNFDTLLEQTFEGVKPSVYSAKDADALLSALSQRSFFIAKLYGDLETSRAIVAPAQYRAIVVNNLAFGQFNQQLFYSRTVFFCGCSLNGILDYLQGSSINATPDRKHYALVAINEPGWEVNANLLSRRYGIQVIPYTATTRYPEVATFLDQLGKATAAAREKLSPEETAHPSAIKRVQLHNIGAFKDLDLELDPNLTILLGDNGVGKSTILRAAAFALAGTDQDSAAAATFLRGDEPSGHIVLETWGGAIYRANIKKRADGGAQVTFVPSTWREREGKLALGFPPLRTVSAGKSRGPEIESQPARPGPTDVLPIVTNLPDPRTNDLKQWMVNLDYRRKSTPNTNIDRLLKDFFDTLTELLEGVKVDFRDLKVEANDIKVVTDDGVVPLNALSQGTVSLIGWIGVLLQRLYEVHDGNPDPRREFAIVLMDEIDAHMHPRWQQSLVSKLQRLFPNIQFVATTHSPFIVSGRKSDEIVRLRRDTQTRNILVEPAVAGTEGTDVTSILMSYLFDLKTPVDGATQELILERRELVVKETLSTADKARLDELNKKLDGVFAAATRDPEYNEYLRAKAKLVASEAPTVPRPLTQKRKDATEAVLQKAKSAEIPVAMNEIDTEALSRAQEILKELRNRSSLS